LASVAPRTLAISQKNWHSDNAPEDGAVPFASLCFPFIYLPCSMDQTQEKTAAMLASLWLRNRPLIEERLAMLDRAASAAADGKLVEELREQAADTAHKLAGSLGMYGYDHGTRIARQLELLLDYPMPDAAQIRALSSQLRQTLFPSA
jgi:HPt (histidine-containing phosphotransfer) domain-containing protein